MKKILLFLLCIISFVQVNAQADNSKTTVASPDTNVNYRLFQTKNIWTFLKLDTRTGEIMQVQYSVESDALSLQYILNDTPLAEGSDAKPGRFFLYPTENMFNFILLDQIDGRVWQVQWNIDINKRFIFRIY